MYEMSIHDLKTRRQELLKIKQGSETKCLTCGNDFLKKRSVSVYCSTSCKNKYYRYLNKNGSWQKKTNPNSLSKQDKDLVMSMFWGVDRVKDENGIVDNRDSVIAKKINKPKKVVSQFIANTIKEHFDKLNNNI